jgi:hypothetical protein
MMVALYPPWWRRRYGDEFETLIDDADLGWSAVFDVLKEALKMQFKMVAMGALGVMLFGVVGWLGGASILLLLSAVASLGCVALAANYFFSGERPAAGRLLLRWSVCAAAYLAILVVVAMLPRTGVLKTDAPYCVDEWCMTVERVSKTPMAEGISYRLDVRLFSLANRTPQSARGASVYLMDELGRRFPQVSDPSAIPLDVVLRPKEAVETSFTFDVPSDAKGLVFAGGMDHIRYASFMIGSPDMLRKPILKLRMQ